MKLTLTVLHIDDDPDTRLLVQELLAAPASGEANFNYLQAEGVEEAVERYGGAALDVILLDNRLGRKEGVELLRLLRQTWDCPVWVLTACAPGALSERCRQQGAAGLLDKDELLESPEQLQNLLLRCSKGPDPDLEI